MIRIYGVICVLCKKQFMKEIESNLESKYMLNICKECDIETVTFNANTDYWKE